MKKYIQMPVVLAALASLIATPSAFGQGTAFTYQGQLQNNGSPASGTYALTFALFNTNITGVAIAGPVTNNAVGVTNGLFTTMIDFGPGVFTGATNWLQIGVATNGVVSFTPLSPRQQLTPTPYAIFANTAGNLGGTLPAAQISGTVASANLSGIYGNALTLNNAGNSFNGSYAGNGASVSNVNAAALNGMNATNFWQLGGNNVAPGRFLGSTNNQPVELWANGSRAFRLEPNPSGAPNVVGGSPANYVAGGVFSATIAGGGQIGLTNRITGTGGVIGGGFNNAVSNFNGVVSGGQNNTAGGNASGIGSGSENDAEGDHAAIASGQANLIQANADHSVIGGGGNNLIIGSYAMPVYSTIGGGQSNTIGTNSIYSTIGGGYGNTNTGFLAIIPGGDQNVATNNSFAAGHRAKAANQGAFVWADSQDTDFSSTANNQFLVRAQGGVGINMNNNPDNLQTAALYAQGANSNGWPNSVVWFQNTASSTNNAPALRVVNTSANATNTDGALSVSIQGQGLIAEFGNSGTFVVTITNNGTVYAAAFVGNGSALNSLNASQISSGTVPLAQLPPVVVTNNSTGLTLSGAFSGNGGGLTNLNAAQLTGAAASLSVTNLTLNGTLNLPAIVTIKAGGGKYLNSDALGNIFLGQGAGNPVVTGFNNVGFGENSLAANITGGNNTAIGYAALISLGNLTSGVGGNDNIALGDSAGSNYQVDESGNIDIGSPGSEFENHTIHIGSSQTQAYIAGVINGNGGGLTNLNASQLTSIGNTSAGASGNYFVGTSGNSTVSSVLNTALGQGALLADTSGGWNTAFGGFVLTNNTTGSNNTAVGVSALAKNTIGSYNTAVGYAALYNNTNGSDNTAYGPAALGNSHSGSLNTAIGFTALEFLGSGSNNIALGYDAGFAFNGNESSNIDIGNIGVTGENNIIRIGTSQTQTYIAGVINGNGGGLTNLIAAQMTGSFTNGFVINGSQSGGIGSPLALIQNNNTSGNTAPALRAVGVGNSPNGVLSVSSQGTGLIAQFGNANAFVADITTNGTVDATSFSGSSVTSGTVSVTNQLRLDDKPVYFRPGGDVNHGLAYSGTTVTNFGTGNVQVDGPVLWGFSGGALAVMNGGAHAVLTWTNGGVSVTGGFAFSSDRNMKTGFAALDSQEVLARVAALPLTSWYYKTDTGARHLGPMAQDFHAAFALDGEDDKHINVGDEGGVALAAIQGLNQKLNEKEAEITELKARLEKLEQLMSARNGEAK